MSILKNFITRNGVKLVKDVDVFLVDGKWVRKELTIIDNFTKKRVLKNNNNLQICYPDLGVSRTVASSNVIICENGPICASALKNGRFTEHLLGSPIYFIVKNVVPITSNPNRQVNYSYASKPLKGIKLKENNIYPNVFNKYTYGIEIETSAGDVGDQELARYGFTTVYDGSIQGHEIVSMPLKCGQLSALREFFEKLKGCARINSSCSLHIHVGNIPRTSENLCRLYDIFYKLQDELWTLIPYYKRESSYLRNSNKDYVKSLVKMDVSVEKIMAFFGLGNITFSNISDLNRFFNEHRKWNIDGRYHAINFINYICNPAGTIELRLLQSTFNWELVQTWIFLNTIIIDYALNNNIIGSKTKVSITDIINSYTDIDASFKDRLIKNIERIKNFYFNAYVSKTDFTKNLENIDSGLSHLLNYAREEN